MFQEQRVYASGLAFRAMETENYFLDYIPGSLNRLVVTFENADAPERPRLDALREPWGGSFLHGKGFSVIGVKPKRVDWYRGADLHRVFRSHSFRVFVSSFAQVVFYGSSMGGYAALAFAASCPGATVIAFNPQSTLHPDLVPWEQRYPEGRAQDWTGDFADAADGAASAAVAYVAYDPLFAPDRRHVERLRGRLVRFRMPLVGHVIAGWMLEARVLAPFIDEALAGTLDETRCRDLARRRRDLPHYHWTMALRGRSAKVAESRLRLLTERGLGPQPQGRIAALLSRHRSWSWLEHERIADALASADDAILVAVLKPAADDGFVSGAAAICRRAMAARPVGWQVRVLAAECAHRLGRLDEALSEAEGAVALAPSVGNCHRILARILLEAGRVAEARDVGETAVAVEPGSARGWLDLVGAHEAAGEPDAARACLDRARRLMPDDPFLAGKAVAMAARPAGRRSD